MCRSVESTPGEPGKLAMMDRVRSFRPTSEGVEVARRGVAGRLQPTLSTGPDVRVRSLKPKIVLPCLRRPTAVEMSKENASKVINFERGVEANLRGGVPGGSWCSGGSVWRCCVEKVGRASSEANMRRWQVKGRG